MGKCRDPETPIHALRTFYRFRFHEVCVDDTLGISGPAVAREIPLQNPVMNGATSL